MNGEWGVITTVQKRGKRAGKTPMEILTGEKQEKDWIELLIKKIESKEADFFS